MRSKVMNLTTNGCCMSLRGCTISGAQHCSVRLMVRHLAEMVARPALGRGSSSCQATMTNLFLHETLCRDWGHWGQSALAFTGWVVMSICLFSVSSSATHTFWRALMWGRKIHTLCAHLQTPSTELILIHLCFQSSSLDHSKSLGSTRIRLLEELLHISNCWDRSYSQRFWAVLESNTFNSFTFFFCRDFFSSPPSWSFLASEGKIRKVWLRTGHIYPKRNYCPILERPSLLYL